MFVAYEKPPMTTRDTRIGSLATDNTINNSMKENIPSNHIQIQHGHHSTC